MKNIIEMIVELSRQRDVLSRLSSCTGSGCKAQVRTKRQSEVQFFRFSTFNRGPIFFRYSSKKSHLIFFFGVWVLESKKLNFLLERLLSAFVGKLLFGQTLKMRWSSSGGGRDVIQCVSENGTKLTWLWCFDFRLKPISGSDWAAPKTVAHAKSGQKWHKK